MTHRGFALIVVLLIIIAGVLVAGGGVWYYETLQQNSGPAPDDQMIQGMMIAFKQTPQQKALEDQLLNDQQDPNSQNYHKWITPEQFGQQFGASTDTITTVSDWLTQRGFSITNQYPDRMSIYFDGTVAQIRNAFQATIYRYHYAGTICYATAGNPNMINIQSYRLNVPPLFSNVILSVTLSDTCGVGAEPVQPL